MNPENRSDEFAKYTQYLAPENPVKGTPKKRRLWPGIAAGVGVAALAVTGGLWAAQDDGTDRVGKSPAVVVTPGVAEDPTDALLSWYESVSEDYTDFADHLDEIAQGNELPTVPQCTVLRDDVNKIMEKPIPDDLALVHNAWNRAMNAYSIAFEACIDGDYLFMMSNMNRGNEEMGRATEAIPE